MATTDPVAARIDELELEIGAGPLTDALAEVSPQFLPDVARAPINPMMAEHLHRLGVRALFAFPLMLGSATLGVAGLYRTTIGGLSAESIDIALRVARTTTAPAVREALRLAAQDSTVKTMTAPPELRREVHQATGMISAQLNITTTEAFARLRAFAVAEGRPLQAIARDVVDGVVDFTEAA